MSLQWKTSCSLVPLSAVAERYDVVIVGAGPAGIMALSLIHI